MSDPACTIETVVLYMDHRSDSWLKAAQSALEATATPCPVEIEIDGLKAQGEDLELEILCYDPETGTSIHYVKRGSLGMDAKEIAAELDPVWHGRAWSAVFCALTDAIEYADNVTLKD
ncbi:MAG: hypothetical protein GY930_18045 [bacterium]|nr:hypothetical protein [Hyphomicrobium sp.]MCP5023657.1 hypothetical protein [bacterium]